MKGAFPDGFGEWFYELRHGLTHKGNAGTWRNRWRYTLTQARCGVGFHWPIKYSDHYYSGGYEPREPTWECWTCGVERLPYRAMFWEGRLAVIPWAWCWLRHPLTQWRYWREDRDHA